MCAQQLRTNNGRRSSLSYGQGIVLVSIPLNSANPVNNASNSKVSAFLSGGFYLAPATLQKLAEGCTAKPDRVPLTSPLANNVVPFPFQYYPAVGAGGVTPGSHCSEGVFNVSYVRNETGTWTLLLFQPCLQDGARINERGWNLLLDKARLQSCSGKFVSTYLDTTLLT